MLGVVAELLTAATYPDDRVEGERDRVAERIAIARSQPGVIARAALAARRYGDHPYAIALPEAELVSAVDGEALRVLHRERVLPAGSTLVLVGDLEPAAAVDVVAGALDRLGGHAAPPSTPRPRPRCTRRGSSWSTVRGPCSPTSGSAARRRPAPIPTWPLSAWPT